MAMIDVLNKYQYHANQVTFVVRKTAVLIGGTTAKL